MPWLPLNPELLLALFTSKENARSLAGYLEERFQRLYRRKGRLIATVWFLRELVLSMPPIMIEALRPKPRSAFVAAGPSLQDVLADEELDESGGDESTGDTCKTWGGCFGRIRWDVEGEHGGRAGHCPECGAFHVECGNCGALSFYGGSEVRCEGCETKWEFTFEDYEVVEMTSLNPDADDDDDSLPVAEGVMYER
jgi:hypothetical protein